MSLITGRSCRGASFATFLALLLARSAAPQTGSLIAKKAFPSVVLLTMADSHGQPLSFGSGFFVTEDLIVTNVHVVSGASQGRANCVGQSNSYTVAGSVAIDEQHDLILLKAVGIKAPALALGDSEAVSVGDDVYAVGNPQGLEGTLSNGIVSAIRQIEGQKILQITAPISPGSSGGPVFDRQGQVIGIAVATFRGGQNLNFAVPASYLSKLLSRQGSVSPLSSRLDTTHSALDALGGRLTEGVQITNRKISCLGSYHMEFSIRNTLPQAVDDVTVLFIFKNQSREPVDTTTTTYSGLPIPPGLAKRPSFLDLPHVPGDLVDEHFSSGGQYTPKFRECVTDPLSSGLTAESDLNFIEIRVLGFRILDEQR